MRIGKLNVENFQNVMEEEINSIKVEKDLGFMIDYELKNWTHT